MRNQEAECAPQPRERTPGRAPADSESVPSPPGADPLPDRRRTPHRPGDPGGVAGVVPPDRIVITTPDGLVLEGAWSPPDGDAVGCVVFCHPHPLDGGTMNAPLMQLVAATLAEAGLWTLRFNFRGVGTSQGTWGGGSGEVLDVAAAVEFAAAAHPALPIGVAGWSFGASTSLRWQAETRSPLPWAGIAPGIRAYRGAAPPAVAGLMVTPRLIVLGDRDQFASVEEMQEFAAAFGAEVAVLEGSDHFFHYRERSVGALVAGHFGGRRIPD